MSAIFRPIPRPTGTYPTADIMVDQAIPPNRGPAIYGEWPDDAIEEINTITSPQAEGGPWIIAIAGGIIYIQGTDRGAQGYPIDLLDAINETLWDAP